MLASKERKKEMQNLEPKLLWKITHIKHGKHHRDITKAYLIDQIDMKNKKIQCLIKHCSISLN